MDCMVAGKIAHQFAGNLLKRYDCLKSQTLRCATTFNRCHLERDNNKAIACEGHTVNRIYQASYATRLVCSALNTTTAKATDRPVYPYCIQWENNSVKQQPFTRHNRFYCTAKTIKKKMVRQLLQKLNIFYIFKYFENIFLFFFSEERQNK